MELHKLNCMVGYADGLTCRRRALLGYFGEPTSAQTAATATSASTRPRHYDATEHAQMALSCVYRLWGRRFGMRRTSSTSCAAPRTRGSCSRGHDRLSTYGIGADVSRDHWQSLIRQLIHRGYLTQDIARYSVLQLTAKSQPLLRGEESLVLARPRTRVPTKKQREAAGRSARAAGLAGLEVDEDLFERLRALRKRLADEQRVPAYVVFSDATLAEMAARAPRTPADLLEISGVGQAKLERYGDAFLDVDRRGTCPSTPPALLYGGRSAVAGGAEELGQRHGLVAAGVQTAEDRRAAPRRSAT